jgi:hypothetical protein
MQDQELTKAFNKAIKKYFEDHDLTATSKLGEQKYSKKYFDGIQKELAPDLKMYGKRGKEEELPAKNKKGKK